MSDPHMSRIWRLRAIGLGGGLLFLAAPLILLRPGVADVSPEVRVLGMTGSVALGVLWAFAFATRGFARADEYLRDVDKTAWFWGGVGGVAASAPVFVFVAMGGLHGLDPARSADPGPARAFIHGYALVVFSQLAGYLVVAAWRRWSKR
jgi:hypothetical protein